MRSRTKDEDAVIRPAGPLTWEAWSAPPWHYDGTSSHGDGSAKIMEEGKSVIIDDPSPSRTTKTVTHTKYKQIRYNIGVEEIYNTDISGVGNYRVRAAGDDAYWSVWGYTHGTISPNQVTASYAKSVEDLKIQAMHKFHSFNEVDTLLNLVESGDIIPSAKSILALAKRNGRLSGELANAWLGWSFGLAPLIADIKKINAAVRKIKSDMDSYIRSYKRGRTIVARSTGTLSVSAPDVLWASSPYDPGNHIWHSGVNYTSVPLRCVGVKGKREIVYNSDLFKRLDYVISRFIATGPASLAWERVKFSFIVDWFVNLTGVIDALDGVLQGTRFSIDDVWVSEKYSALIAGYKHRDTNWYSWYSSSDGKQISLLELSYYHREALTSGPSIGLSGRFGKKQASLLVALLHNFVASLKRLK